jgi:hypothetical protein
MDFFGLLKVFDMLFIKRFRHAFLAKRFSLCFFNSPWRETLEKTPLIIHRHKIINKIK